jgi:hypothetical protein
MTNKNNQSAAQKMLAAFQAQGVTVEEPTFFGIPVSEYFGRSEKGIWHKILDDVTVYAPAAESTDA